MSPALVVAAEGGSAPSGLGVLLPASYDIIWSLVCVAIIAVVVVKWGVPRLNAVLDERAAQIQAGLEKAENADAVLAQAEDRAATELSEARREAADIRERANRQGKEAIAAAHAKAAAESERQLASAGRQIDAERRQAELSLKSDVGSLAVQLASRVVGESLQDQALQSRIVDRFLDDLDAQLDNDARDRDAQDGGSRAGEGEESGREDGEGARGGASTRAGQES